MFFSNTSEMDMTESNSELCFVNWHNMTRMVSLLKYMMKRHIWMLLMRCTLRSKKCIR